MAFVLDRESSTMEYNPAIGSRRFQSPSIHSTGMAPVTPMGRRHYPCWRAIRISEYSSRISTCPVRWMVLRWPRSRQCNGLISRSSLVPATCCPDQAVYHMALRLFASLMILEVLSGSFMRERRRPPNRGGRAWCLHGDLVTGTEFLVRAREPIERA